MFIRRSSLAWQSSPGTHPPSGNRLTRRADGKERIVESLDAKTQQVHLLMSLEFHKNVYIPGLIRCSVLSRADPVELCKD